MREGKELLVGRTKSYLLGIAAGIVAANSYAKTVKGVELYCPPTKLVVDANNYDDIVRETIQEG